MLTCQNCGCHIPATQRVFKRELYSGTSQRVNYGRRVSYGTTDRYAIKSVCSDCAETIDNVRKARRDRKTVRLLVIAILLVIYLLLK